MAAEVTTEVTLTERSTVAVTATASRYWEGGPFSAQMTPWVQPSPVGWIYGPVGCVVAGQAAPGSDWWMASGALTYVVTLDPGTYDLGVSVHQSQDGWTGLEVSVSVVVGCNTETTTISGGE